jgi:ABC-type sugar transport system permease subunit
VDGSGPVAALSDSLRLVKGRFWPLAGVYAAALAAVLVFVVLAGIFVGVLMAIAGQQGPTSVVGRMSSRLLFSVVIALPVVYGSALHVVVWRTLRVPPRT